MSMISSDGLSRMSLTFFLYAMPSTSTLLPFMALRREFSARITFCTQKRGMSELTLPASSMNSVWKSNSRAFHVR